MAMGEESNRLQSDLRIAMKGKDGISARLDDSQRQLAQMQNQVTFSGSATCKVTLSLEVHSFYPLGKCADGLKDVCPMHAARMLVGSAIPLMC